MLWDSTARPFAVRPVATHARYYDGRLFATPDHRLPNNLAFLTMSRYTRTSAELAVIFPPVSAAPRTTQPVGIVPAATASLGTLFWMLHRELFGKRYRRTLNAAGPQH